MPRITKRKRNMNKKRFSGLKQAQEWWESPCRTFFTNVPIVIKRCEKAKKKNDLQPYAKMCFPDSMGSKIMIKLAFKRLRCRQRKSRDVTSSVLTLVLSRFCFPCSMGSIKMTPQNDENSLKLLTACGFYAFQVRKHYL